MEVFCLNNFKKEIKKCFKAILMDLENSENLFNLSTKKTKGHTNIPICKMKQNL